MAHVQYTVLIEDLEIPESGPDRNPILIRNTGKQCLLSLTKSASVPNVG
jgi:hypothetical protein